MEELLEEHYMYNDICILIKSVYSLVQAAHWCFKDYIKTMTLKVRFKQFNTDPYT